MTLTLSIPFLLYSPKKSMIYWSAMKLIGSVSQLRLRISRVCLFSTQTQSFSPASENNRIHDWVYSLRYRPVAIRPVLDKWVERGGELEQAQLHGIMKTLKKTRHFAAALQVSDWMYEKGSYDLSTGYVAIRLDLISKALGLRKARKYFDDLPTDFKVTKVYGALLNCYASHQKVDDAETVMEKIRELGLSDSPLQYNVMLNLYSRTGHHEKFEKMVQEMEEKGFKPDIFTYGLRLNAFVATSNVEGMEKLLTKIGSDPLVMDEWNVYADAASCFLKMGRVEKSLAMLKKAEECMIAKPGKNGYEFILSLYASIGHKDEVYRIWNLYKNLGKLQNRGYVSMISSLVKLDDIDGAQKIFVEWLTCQNDYVVKIPSLLINACCKKGLFDKAEAIVKTLRENKREPDAIMWNLLASGYCNAGQMEKAVETLKKAMISSEPERRLPNESALATCLKYLREKGDDKAAVEILRLKPRFYSEMHKLYYA